MTPEEILNEQGLAFRVKGKDLVISCLNPRHEDSHPSMHVDKQTGLFHCFSCKTKGNIFTHFNKILNTLNLKQQNILNMINNLSPIKLNLPKDAKMFKETYRNIKPETYEHFDVFKSEEFADRLVLPIYNFKKDIIAFIGRYQYSKLEPKYKVHPSGKSLPLFPPAIEINSDTIIIVEGMFDLLNLYDKGITNVVCSFGLLSVDKYNKKLLEKLIPYKICGVTKILICYDGDKPGRQAAMRLVNALDEDFFIDSINLEDGQDPGAMTLEEVVKLKKYLTNM